MSTSTKDFPSTEDSNTHPMMDVDEIDTTIDTNQARIAEMENIPIDAESDENHGSSSSGEGEDKEAKDGAAASGEATVSGALKKK